MNTTNAKPGFKQKVSRETKEFMTIYLYLVLLIGAFNIYRWLLMAEYHVGYFVYGYSLVEALILAKVIIIGEGLGIGERFADRPLILPTRYEILGRVLIMFVAFIPFFAFRETMRVLREAKLFDLFFRSRAVAPSPSP